MNLPFHIARRYFFSGKKPQFINIISLISLAVVTLGTMALIIALSVFNGLEEVVRDLHQTFNADLQISLAKGKSFKVDDPFRQKIQAIEGIQVISEVIEDNALLRYREGQMVVTMKGVSENFMELSKMDSALTQGEFILDNQARTYAVIGRGIQMIMSINIRNELDPIELWYPKSSKKVNLSNFDPAKSFNKKTLFASGVFSLEKNYDEKYIFLPLTFAEKLMDYKDRRTSIELKIRDPAKIDRVQRDLRQVLGKEFVVKNSDEQQASLLKAIQIEKFFVYLTLSFILAVASFNIFFSLMMLVIDKRQDIGILLAMGAQRYQVQRIFFLEGIIIAFTGAGLGLFLGTVICLLQQEYGLVSMGTTMTIISAYPVKLLLSDFLYTGLTIIIITLLSSYFPALQASRSQVKDNV